ncbi:MAG TPA: hypothetical protein QF720_02495 [Nitrospinota bacterium]|nr:hypothetical protein [Nitrospinota bacterium]|tara:strand:+ start:4429 stop:4815 length:387 start_codon:yes stop_codon:yes gene_type:complete
MLLLYIVESAVPILTVLLIWAVYNAWKKNILAHRKAATLHAVATLVSTALVFVLVRLGYSVGEEAPKWIRDIHFVIIYQIPILLGFLMYFGLSGRRKIHKRFAIYYLLIWTAALATGLMIFLTHNGLI